MLFCNWIKYQNFAVKIALQIDFILGENFSLIIPLLQTVSNIFHLEDLNVNIAFRLDVRVLVPNIALSWVGPASMTVFFTKT